MFPSLLLLKFDGFSNRNIILCRKGRIALFDTEMKFNLDCFGTFFWFDVWGICKRNPLYEEKEPAKNLIECGGTI